MHFLPELRVDRAERALPQLWRRTGRAASAPAQRAAFVLRGRQTIAQWFASPPDDLRSLAKRWFEEFRSSGPNVLELLHDGRPTACVDDLALGYVNAFADHVNVGFYFGAVLPDPLRLLEGSGRYMRHVKLRPRVFVRELALRQLIRDAYVDTTSRLALRQAKPIRGS